MYDVLLVIHTLLVLFLIGMVLIQRTDSDGLAGLGGGGGNQFLTGRGSANLMTRATAILAGVFMLTSLLLAIMASRMNQTSVMDALEVAPVVGEETKKAPMADDATTSDVVPKPEDAPVAPKAAQPEEKPTVPKPE